MKKSILVVTMASMLLLASCGNKGNETSSTDSNASSVVAEHYPLTLKTYDAESKEISQTYTAKPSKVITGNLSSTELLVALGLESSIIGMINPDNTVTGEYAEKINQIKHLGDKKNISYETIIDQDPDFIFSRAASFAVGSANKAGNLGTPSELNKLDITMYAQKASISDSNISLDYILDDVKNIGKIFDVEEKANTYASSLSAIEEAVKATAKKNGVVEGSYKRALIMTGYGAKTEGGVQTYGVFKSSLQEKMLNILGYTNYYSADISGSTYTPENLVSQNPELIVYVTSDRNKEKDATAVELMKANDVLSDVPAVKNDKILKINYDDFMDYGIRAFSALKTISDYVYGK